MKIDSEKTKDVLAGLDAAEEKIYILNYKANVIGSSFKTFKFTGTPREAFVRGQKHCKTMNYRFLGVSLLGVDLDAEEAAKNKEGSDAGLSVVKTA